MSRAIAVAAATFFYFRCQVDRAQSLLPGAVCELQTMRSYKAMIAENTTLVLSTENDLFKFLKGMTPSGDAVPAPRSGANR
jgi:modulator of FtsH protease HflC